MLPIRNNCKIINRHTHTHIYIHTPWTCKRNTLKGESRASNQRAREKQQNSCVSMIMPHSLTVQGVQTYLQIKKKIGLKTQLGVSGHGQFTYVIKLNHLVIISPFFCPLYSKSCPYFHSQIPFLHLL